MKKMLVTLSLIAGLGVLPGLVGSAEARHKHNRNCHHGVAGPNGYGYRGGSAWDIVRSDPRCFDEFRRYANKHKNPNKRARKIEKLAREGCGPQYGVYDGGYGYGGDYGYDYPEYGGYPTYPTNPYPYGNSNPYPYGNSNPYGYGYAPTSPAEAVIYPLLGLLLGQ